MKKQILILLGVVFTFTISAAEKIRGYVRDSKQQPIIGATVVWENSRIGGTTNTDGFFEIDDSPSSSVLMISYIGYDNKRIENPDRTNEINVVLKDNVKELGEVVVVQRGGGAAIQRKALVQTQKITIGEIRRDACCNLGESFTTNPSVDVVYADAATGAKQIKLLGLNGTYVQMLTENYPNFRGAASPFGMDYVPAGWMEGIYVSKGTSSVKNGYEALTGQINVEFKKPQTMDKFSVDLFANDGMNVEVATDASVHLNENVQTAVFAHYGRDMMAHDKDKDGFLDYPKTEKFNLMNRWNHTAGNYVGQYGVRYVHENRIGGQDTNHNNFVDPYVISLKTNRGEFYTKQAYSTVNDEDLMTSFAIIGSGSLHDQKSQYDLTPYNVYQKNLYLNMIFEKEFLHAHSLSTGLSYNYDGFDEMLRQTNFNRSESTPGAYIQYTYNWNDKWIFLTGVRADYSSMYGFFVTPRMHVKFTPNEWFNLRASWGKGFRTANVLAENNYLLASSRKVNIADNLEQEEAWNTGLNATFYIPVNGDRKITLSCDYYYTKFLHQVVVDVDSDPHAINFYNLNGGKSYANSAQVEINYPVTEGLTLIAAYRYSRAMSDFVNQETGEKRFLSRPLMNDYKGLFSASYHTPMKKWQFDATLQLNGGGRMPTPDKINPLWEESYKPFNILNIQTTHFFRGGSVYLGVDNVFDFRNTQPFIDSQNPRSDNFDATMVWGPVHGRKIYAGIRYNIPRF